MGCSTNELIYENYYEVAKASRVSALESQPPVEKTTE